MKGADRSPGEKQDIKFNLKCGQAQGDGITNSNKLLVLEKRRKRKRKRTFTN